MAIWRRGFLKSRLLNRLSAAGRVREAAVQAVGEGIGAKWEELTQTDAPVVRKLKHCLDAACMATMTQIHCFMTVWLQIQNGAGYRWHFPAWHICCTWMIQWVRPTSINQGKLSLHQAVHLSFWINQVVGACVCKLGCVLKTARKRIWSPPNPIDSSGACMTDQDSWKHRGARSRSTLTAWLSPKLADLNMPNAMTYEIHMLLQVKNEFCSMYHLIPLNLNFLTSNYHQWNQSLMCRLLPNPEIYELFYITYQAYTV